MARGFFIMLVPVRWGIMPLSYCGSPDGCCLGQKERGPGRGIGEGADHVFAYDVMREFTLDLKPVYGKETFRWRFIWQMECIVIWEITQEKSNGVKPINKREDNDWVS
ncbi:MAG: hypothetical protein V8S98_07265 [Lachnospiraceae bacterium]